MLLPKMIETFDRVMNSHQLKTDLITTQTKMHVKYMLLYIEHQYTTDVDE